MNVARSPLGALYERRKKSTGANIAPMLGLISQIPTHRDQIILSRYNTVFYLVIVSQYIAMRHIAVVYYTVTHHFGTQSYTNKVHLDLVIVS